MRRIGFIVSEFPRPVDAYLLRELLALVEAGLDVRIYSLRHPSGAAAPRAAGTLLGATTYPPHLGAREMRAAHASWLRTANATTGVVHCRAFAVDISMMRFVVSPTTRNS